MITIDGVRMLVTGWVDVTTYIFELADPTTGVTQHEISPMKLIGSLQAVSSAAAMLEPRRNAQRAYHYSSYPSH